MKYVGHVALMAEDSKVYRVLVGKPEGKKTLGRLSCRWKNGIRMDLWEIGWSGVDCIVGSGYGPMAGSCECSDEHTGSGTT
jgi:hypothetical protein